MDGLQCHNINGFKNVINDDDDDGDDDTYNNII